MTGPCAWTVSYAACSTCAPLDDMSEEERATFEGMAAEFLWNWTLRQFGICSVALRPCRADCVSWTTFFGGGPFPRGIGGPGRSWPYLIDGKWFNQRGCGCRGSCTCAVPNSLELPGPVSAVTEVLIDGDVLAPAAYRLDGNLLIRLDGETWPSCQSLELPATEDGTWQITYDRGQEVPAGGQIAAGLLACELAKAACHDSTCQLPQRLQTVTRQGVTLAMIDKFEGLDKGRTGLWLVDSWVASVIQPRRSSRVFSVDVRRPVNRMTSLTSSAAPSSVLPQTLPFTIGT